MIAYFVDNYFKQKATVTTEGKNAQILDDTAKRDITGLSTLDLTIRYTDNPEDFGQVGEFIFLPATENRDACFYQIITREVDYIERTISYFGDTNFLWFSSQNVNDGTYGRVSEIGKNIAWYLEEFTTGSAPFSYTIGTNEISGALATGDTNASTAKEALEKTAALFNCEISFSFDFDGKTVTPYINIYEQYGNDVIGEVLTVGKDITELVETSDCSEIATAVKITGAVKSSKEYASAAEMVADEDLDLNTVVIAEAIPYCNMQLTTVFVASAMKDPQRIYKYNGLYYRGNRTGTNQETVTGLETQEGFAVKLVNSTIGQENYIYTPLPAYDSGDYYTENGYLFSRSAWYRFGAPESGKRENAYFSADIILKADDMETTDGEQVLNHAIALLEAQKNPVITYDCKCKKRVQLGAYYTIVIPGGYISARCLEVEESDTRKEYTPTFGNYLKSQNAFEVMAKNA